ncbi:39S ribosomal protein L52, mitochondrial [Latimeria chalumnae]|uniref:Large ribosomal subunit protein mL52 n=1 Tax=Latimeria chalumnae TaxID=7897 RepID=H3A447_LATCH|nr:PREDICTED: 39S ribosomal protein L52, mitochondrial [Latimeria chalumnae]|eukprot:XP_006009824.1 PREDICTED: 39S ribosomal protein L52, mitochondrial [Latimeria chalumnae]
MAAPMGNRLLAGLRLHPSLCQITVTRGIARGAACCAGSKWRAEHGMARSDSEYGPMTDLPDWSYADGRPGPLMNGQKRRKEERAEFARRVVMLSSEVDRGMEQWRKKQEKLQREEKEKREKLLKPKGDKVLKKKPFNPI